MIASNDPRLKALIDAGIISPRCKRFTLTIDAGDVAILRQEVFVSGDEFDALARLIPEAEHRTTAIHEKHQGATIDITPLGVDWREKIAKP